MDIHCYKLEDISYRGINRVVILVVEPVIDIKVIEVAIVCIRVCKFIIIAVLAKAGDKSFVATKPILL